MPTVTLKPTYTIDEHTYTQAGYTILVDSLPIGAVALFVGEHDAYLERIDIDAEHQGQGFGSLAISLLLAIYPGIYTAPDNPDSQRLFARIGTETSSYPEVDQGYGVYTL